MLQVILLNIYLKLLFVLASGGLPDHNCIISDEEMTIRCVADSDTLSDVTSFTQFLANYAGNHQFILEGLPKFYNRMHIICGYLKSLTLIHLAGTTFSFDPLVCDEPGNSTINNIIILDHNYERIDGNQAEKLNFLMSFKMANGPLIIVENTYFANSNIEILNLTSNKIEVIESLSFFNMTRLKYLVLSNNLIRQLPSDIFTGTIKLSSIRVDLNLITTIPTNLLKNLTNLRVLIISDNSIRKFDSKLLNEDSWKQIQHLDISNNSIEVLDLRNINPDIYYLYLGSNKFSGISNFPTFTGNLKSILINDLPFNCDCNLLPVINFYVKYIYIISPKGIKNKNGQNIVCFKPQALKGKFFSEISEKQICSTLSKSTTIDTTRANSSNHSKCRFKTPIIECANSSLQVVVSEIVAESQGMQIYYSALKMSNIYLDTNTTFDVTTNYTLMILTGSNLTTMNHNFLKSFTNLKSLKLDYNKLANITSGEYPSKNTMLVELSLSHNLLSEIKNDAFKQTSELVDIDLSFNLISFIENRVFQNLASLMYLNLQHNYLKDINSLIIPANLYVLYCNDNKLTALSYKVLTIRFVFFMNNPLKCAKDIDINLRFKFYLKDLISNSIEDVWQTASTKNITKDSITRITCKFECQNFRKNIIFVEYSNNISCGNSRSFDLQNDSGNDSINLEAWLNQSDFKNKTTVPVVPIKLINITGYNHVEKIKATPPSSSSLIGAFVISIIIISFIAFFFYYKYWYANKIAKKIISEYVDYQPTYPYAIPETKTPSPNKMDKKINAPADEILAKESNSALTTKEMSKIMDAKIEPEYENIYISDKSTT
ncbi:unnamed protein product [Gordionus sp. m RMFG-2023]|uniref:SLIT and NTRK-like protein 2 n=1 Tax=Gordionus sp. m RMFG-2023 TaxID=3053472 RepID=UPI0030E210CF